MATIPLQDVREIREVTTDRAANELLKQGWALLEIKTVATQYHLGNTLSEFTSAIVYVLGRLDEKTAPS